MKLSDHDLLQLTEEELLELPEEVLRRLSIKLLYDLKEARERLKQTSRISSRPPSSDLPWDKTGSNDEGSSRFRGMTTTYSVRHSQITAYLRHQARYAGITDLSHISHNNAA